MELTRLSRCCVEPMSNSVRERRFRRSANGWGSLSRRTTAGGDGVVKLFDAENHELIRELVGHQDSVYSLAVSQDGMHVAAGAHDGKVLVWNVETPDPPNVLLAVP